MKKYSILYEDSKKFGSYIQEQELKQDCRYFICIHTSRHHREEAVEVAKEIKKQLPMSEIAGTSADYIIYNGDIVEDACLVLVYEFEKSDFRMGMVRYEGLSPEELIAKMNEQLGDYPIKAMFTFFSDDYSDSQFFVEAYNENHAHIRMIGGVAGTIAALEESGYVFNENGSSKHSVVFCGIYGEELHCYSDIITGHEALGEVCTVTKSEGIYVDEVDGEPFAAWLKEQLGVNDFVENAYNEDIADKDILLKFPLVMQNYGRTSRFVQYEKATGRMMLYNTKIREGKTFRIGYLSPMTTANECKELCERMKEQPAEVIVSYSCIFRKTSLNNCAFWEMLPFKNCNICGAFMHGEIGYFNGKNEYLNGSNSLFTMAESEKTLPIDMSAFDKMYRIEDDRKDLYNYVLKKQSETIFKKNAMLLQQIVEQEQEVKKNMFEDKNIGIPNMTKYSYDNKFRKFNKMCMVTLTRGHIIQAHLGEEGLNEVLKNIIEQIREFINDERLRIYKHNEYSFIVVANEAYDLPDFVKLSEQLYANFNKVILPEQDLTCVNAFAVVIHEKDLLEKARYASYEAERSNNRYVVFDKNKKLQERQSLNDTLHMVTIISEAIRKDRIVPFFQPIYDNRTKKFSHVESLMRIKDKEGTLYFPNQFMDIAKDYRLYLELSKVMIMKVFDLFEHRPEKVSMNISAYDIQEEATRQAIYHRLEQMSEKSRSHFIFEVLESENYEDQQILMQFIHEVRNYGVKIAIDDFGAGYSNLLEIASLDPDYLKIDGQLIMDFVNDRRKQIIVDTIVFMADKLNLNVVAERVENKEIQDEIVKKGIAYTQGYYFSKPMDFDSFVEFQEKHWKIG